MKYLRLIPFLAFIGASSVYAKQSIPSLFYYHSPTWLKECNLAGSGPQNQECNIGPLQLINILLPNVLIGAGVIFFGLILVGGFGMIAGAGKEENAQDKAKAQGAITYGVIGFLLVVSAYFILQIVGTVTGINFFSPTFQ